MKSYALVRLRGPICKALVLATLLAVGPLGWKPAWGQTPGMRVKPSDKEKHASTSATDSTTGNQRGTKESPLVVDIEGHKDSPAEAADKKREEDEKHDVDTWTLRLAAINSVTTIILALIGIAGVCAAVKTLKAIKKQADHMETQTGLIGRQVDLTEPRLHVDSVRAAAFGNGQSPVFFVKVVNSGIIAAENVTISMKAEIAPGKTVTYNKDQIIAIPADGSRECFMPSGTMLNESQIAEWDSGTTPLRISGDVKWNGKTVEYCYKYNPWSSENRPEGIPIFVPCDFDTSRKTTIGVSATTLPMTGGLPDVMIEGPSEPEPPQED